jgi:hypothetical protein
VAGRLREHDDAHGGEERRHEDLAEAPRPALRVGEVHDLCKRSRFDKQPSGAEVRFESPNATRDNRTV